MKKIRTYITTIALFAFTISGFSQKGQITKDPFTGERIVKAGNSFVYFESKNGKIRFDIGLTYSGQLTEVMPVGTEVLIKLANGSTVKLETATEAKPSSQVYASQYSAGIVTHYSYSFSINKETATEFSTTKVELIRFPDTKGGKIDIEGKSRLGKKYVKSIMKGSKYIVENY